MTLGQVPRRLAYIASAAILFGSPVQYARADTDPVRAEVDRLLVEGDSRLKNLSASSVDSAIGYAEAAMALAISEFGPNDHDVARSMAQLSICYFQKSDLQRALEYATDAVATMEAAAGPDAPELARVLRILGDVYYRQGRFAEAEPVYLRGLRVLESVSDLDRFGVNQALLQNNLSHIYSSQGRLEEAKAYSLAALEIWQDLHGEESYWAGIGHQSLGLKCKSLGDTAEAELHLRKAVAIFASAVGPDSYKVAHATRSLAEFLMSQERYDEAANLLAEAVRIEAALYPEDDPILNYTLMDYAWVQGRLGHWQEAVALAERIEQIGVETAQYYSLERQAQLAFLANTYAGAGMDERCLAKFQELSDTRRSFLYGAFAYATTQQKMRYLKLKPPLDRRFLSWVAEHDSEEGCRAALEMILSGKAYVIDALAAEREVAYCAYDADLTTKLTHHAATSGAIASLVLAQASADATNGISDSLSTLYQIQDSLEISISRDCAEFRAERDSREFTADDVARALPTGSTLWELVRYWPWDFQEFKSDSARYLSFVLSPEGSITVVDLGDAALIDSLIAEIRSSLRDAPRLSYAEGASATEESFRKVAEQLHALLIAPVEPAFAEARRIFISPDADLHLFPFEVLCAQNGGYLIEKYEISYLATGRDLLKQEHYASHDLRSPAVVADPDYESSPPPVESALLTLRGPAEDPEPAEATRGSTDCLSFPYEMLPSTRSEGDMIVQLTTNAGIEEPEMRCGVRASESYLKSLDTAPRFLHIATHGYFCEANDAAVDDNPLLYSGLALAGANQTVLGERNSGARDDGILTAFEASGLNLIGTKLVVLSACQTGLGEVVTGEGVFGLRRAFHHAGAQSIVMSMFSVPDEYTAMLMERFYRNWLAGSTKSKALRDAALSVMRERRAEHASAHPLFWGGFILAGDPN